MQHTLFPEREHSTVQGHETGPENLNPSELLERSYTDMLTVDDRVARELGLPSESLEVHAESDRASAYIAESMIAHEGEMGAGKVDVDAAIGVVVLESDLEDSGQRLTDGPSPRDMLIADGLEERMRSVEADIGSALVQPEDFDSGVVLREETQRLAEYPMMGGEPTAVELVGNRDQGYGEVSRDSRVARYIDNANIRAQEHAEIGVERSEFKGPEVREAIEGYYVDHELTLAMIKGLMGDDISHADFEDMHASIGNKLTIQNKTLNACIRKLVDARQQGKNENFGQFALDTLQLVYQEPCVGQLTLSAEDIARIAEEKARLVVEIDRIRNPNSKRDIDKETEQQVRNIEGSIKSARGEVRPAGQLLFHNTVFGNDVWTQGALRGRAQQRGSQSDIKTTTANLEGHSELIHWSELYDNQSYKRMSGLANGTQGSRVQAVTFAVPIGEVIKRAPFARGLEYGVVGARPGRSVTTAEVGREGSRVIGHVGPGMSDGIRGEPSIDRVFWSSADDPDTSAAYDVPIRGDDIMVWNPDRGIEEPVVYQIQSESDMAENFADYNQREYRRHPDPAVAAAESARFRQLSADQVHREMGRRIDDPRAGVGYGYPGRKIINDIGFSTEPGTSLDTSRSGGNIGNPTSSSAAESAIREIERESMDRFEGKYVVPLRAREEDFMFRDDNLIANRFSRPVESMRL